MASIAACEQALQALADRLASADADAKSKAALDRTISCRLRDLDLVFAGRLHDGELVGIAKLDPAKADSGPAQVRMTMTSDDLIKLVAGELHMGSAWATGRIRIDASVRDLLRLRTLF